MVVLVIQHPGMVWTTLDTRAAGGTKGMQLDEVARRSYSGHRSVRWIRGEVGIGRGRSCLGYTVSWLRDVA